MYEDVPSSIMLDNTILNELVIENVTGPDTQKNLKTSEKSTSLAFFFILIFNVVTMYIQCSNLRSFCKILKKI